MKLFTIEELMTIPEELRSKLLDFIDNKTTETQELQSKNNEIIKAYNELNEVYTNQKQIMMEQSEHISDMVQGVSVQEFNTLNAERKRIDDLLFINEEEVKNQMVKNKQLKKELAELKQQNAILEKKYKSADLLASVACTRLKEGGYILPQSARPKKQKSIYNINKFININTKIDDINEDELIEAAISDKVIIDDLGHYQISK